MATRPFQLSRYFTLTSLAAFAVLGTALLFVQRGEEKHFDRVQRERNDFFARIQAELLQEQKDAARASLVATHEAGHVSLARVMANALWSSHFAQLVNQAQAVPIKSCKPPPEMPPEAAAQAQQSCVAKARAQVMALPAFSGIDAPVRSLMRGTAVYKVKVYDLRGLTVYSSELAQVGEAKADNRGWQSGAAGRTASELVHRNQFSAFEGTVKDRDLIQSYIPVMADGGRVAGVFEIYSDVTTLLQQVDGALARAAAIGARNQARVQQAAALEQQAVVAASNRFLLTIVALLVLTYVALLLLVRRGQRLIDGEARARERAAEREQEWHRDKMAAVGAMAGSIAHQVGNPLALISAAAQKLAKASGDNDDARVILDQAARIQAMTDRINEFAEAGVNRPEPVDLNRQVQLVSHFLAYDRRFHGTPIDLQLAPSLPPCNGIPDQLNESLMGLLQALEKGCDKCATPRGQLAVQTSLQGSELAVRITGECALGGGCGVPSSEPRLESARIRIVNMGGRLAPCDSGVEIRLPAAEASASQTAV